MLSEEFGRLWPQRRYGLRGVVKVDRETVRLVVIRHEAEHVVIDVAEEMYLGFYTPIELCVLESRMLVEKTTVPPAHLVVGFQVAVLDVVLFEDFGGFFEEFVVNP